MIALAAETLVSAAVTRVMTGGSTMFGPQEIPLRRDLAELLDNDECRARGCAALFAYRVTDAAGSVLFWNVIHRNDRVYGEYRVPDSLMDDEPMLRSAVLDRLHEHMDDVAGRAQGALHVQVIML